MPTKRGKQEIYFWMVVSDGLDISSISLPISHTGSVGKYRYAVSCDNVLGNWNHESSLFSVNIGGFRSGSASGNDLKLQIKPSVVLVDIPISAVDGMYLKEKSSAVELSTNPKLLHEFGMQTDERAFHSLLEFGAIVPPLTPWRGIARLLPGKIYEIDMNNLSIHCSKGNGLASADTKELKVDRLQRLATEIDGILQSLCPDRRPVILFSGGVDSGLLAARCAAMGWKETLLVNSQIGEDDPDSIHAEAMANHLGLPFERVRYTTDNLKGYLSQVGDIYPLPFGDISAYATFLLARTVIQKWGGDYRVVLDGRGADSTFGRVGEARRWSKLARLPRIIKELGGIMYENVYVASPSRFGHDITLGLHSLREMDPLIASVASPLCNLMYHSRKEVQAETRSLLSRWLESCFPSSVYSFVQRFTLLNLILVCCNVYAQKDKPIFDDSPMDVRYPFLQPSMIALALESVATSPEGAERKLPLKLLLAQHVPREMVFRRKSPVSYSYPSTKELLCSPAFLAAFDEMLQCTSSPFSPLLDRERILEMLNYVRQEKPLPQEIFTFVWATVFMNLWIMRS